MDHSQQLVCAAFSRASPSPPLVSSGTEPHPGHISSCPRLAGATGVSQAQGRGASPHPQRPPSRDGDVLDLRLGVSHEGLAAAGQDALRAQTPLRTPSPPLGHPSEPLCAGRSPLGPTSRPEARTHGGGRKQLLVPAGSGEPRSCRCAKEASGSPLPAAAEGPGAGSWCHSYAVSHQLFTEFESSHSHSIRNSSSPRHPPPCPVPTRRGARCRPAGALRAAKTGTGKSERRGEADDGPVTPADYTKSLLILAQRVFKARSAPADGKIEQGGLAAPRQKET